MNPRVVIDDARAITLLREVVASARRDDSEGC